MPEKSVNKTSQYGARSMHDGRGTSSTGYVLGDRAQEMLQDFLEE